MKGKPTVPSVQSALRVTPKRWRCTTCNRVNDTRSPDPVCGHVPPWVEADRQQEADLRALLTPEQQRMAAFRAMQAAGGHNRLPDDLRNAIREARGTLVSIADRFGVSVSTVKSIKGGRPRLPDAIVEQVLKDPRSANQVAKALGISKSAAWAIRSAAKDEAPSGSLRA